MAKKEPNIVLLTNQSLPKQNNAKYLLCKPVRIVFQHISSWSFENIVVLSSIV